MEDTNKNLDTNQNNENKNDETKTTYTLEEVQELLQKEGDRRVSMLQKKYEKQKAEAIKEAEKLARMNEEDKYKYELEQREKKIAEKEKQIALMENRAEASKALASRGISIDLVDLVVSEDADDMMANIKKLEDEFKKSVNAEVTKVLGGDKTPARSSETKEMTREEFGKLSILQQSELLRSNPDKYEKFI